MTAHELSYEDKRKCEREVLASLFNKFNELSVEMGLSNLQNVHTPYFLCDEMIKKLEEYGGTLKNKTFAVFNFEFIDVLVNVFGVLKENITFFTDNDLKIGLVVNHYNGVNVMKKNFDKESLMEKNPWGGKTFHCVIMNPPYQTDKGDVHSGDTNGLWPQFVQRAISLCKENGYVASIHPSAWRGNGKFNKVGELLKSRDIKFLEINNMEKGQKTFGVSTRYDWYVLKNCANSGETNIVDENENKYCVNISKMGIIPNFDVDIVLGLIAKENEEKVQLIASQSMYQVCREHMSDTQDEVFKYPCVKYISKKNLSIDIRWSCLKKEHFGVKKVIFGTGAQVGGIYIDYTGEYGMCNFVAGIASQNDEELRNIKTALESDKFKRIMKACQFTTQMYNKNVIELFRKDFWKNFI